MIIINRVTQAKFRLLSLALRRLDFWSGGRSALTFANYAPCPLAPWLLGKLVHFSLTMPLYKVPRIRGWVESTFKSLSTPLHHPLAIRQLCLLIPTALGFSPPNMQGSLSVRKLIGSIPFSIDAASTKSQWVPRPNLLRPMKGVTDQTMRWLDGTTQSIFWLPAFLLLSRAT